MKRMVKIGFFALVLAVSLVLSCKDNSPANPTGPSPWVKETVNLDIPGVAEILAFNASKGYNPATEPEAKKIIDDLFDEIDSMLVSTKSPLLSLSRSMSRAVTTETLQMNFSETEELNDVDYVSIRGYIDITMSADDENFVPFTCNGDSQFRVEIQEGFGDDDFELIGVITGSANAANINIDETSASGSLTGSVKCAINIADKTEKIWLKCIANVNMNISLTSIDQTITLTFNIDAYGENNAKLNNYAKSISLGIDDLMEL